MLFIQNKLFMLIVFKWKALFLYQMKYFWCKGTHFFVVKKHMYCVTINQVITLFWCKETHILCHYISNSNTFLDVKEHISCVLIDQTVVTLKIGTLTRCVIRRQVTPLWEICMQHTLKEWFCMEHITKADFVFNTLWKCDFVSNTPRRV